MSVKRTSFKLFKILIMKILIISQYYWPENSRVTDIAESLYREGNNVTVLTGLPNYPQGYIYEGYKHGENRKQIHNGVNIIRAKLIERRHDTFHRLLNYYSFPHYANKLVNKLDKDFDVVLAMEESPIMLVKPAIKYAKKYNKKVIMYEMDLWPESLLAGGIKKDSFIYNHYKKISAKIYSQMDKILVSTKEHIDYIKALPNCSNLDIDYLPQYAESIFEESNYETIDNGAIDLMFAGNIGKAQSIDTIIKAANLLKDDKRFMFHIVGDGSELENCKKLANELKCNNVKFYGSMPLSEMPKMYALADAMLVTLEDKSYANMTIPGKVQSYMAVGKPIIASINGSTSSFIKENNIGYVCESEDYNELAELIKSLDKNRLKELGLISKKRYFEKYSKDSFISSLFNHVETVVVLSLKK